MTSQVDTESENKEMLKGEHQTRQFDIPQSVDPKKLPSSYGKQMVLASTPKPSKMTRMNDVKAKPYQPLSSKDKKGFASTFDKVMNTETLTQVRTFPSDPT